MAKFMLLHVGFDKPTPELMEAWQTWFKDVADITLENVGFAGGSEVTRTGTTELAWDANCLTGYSVIDVPDRAAAEAIAARNPYITAIRVYELREHG
ncbi:MAG: YciI family protein [Pseudomonadota bacterium]